MNRPQAGRGPGRARISLGERLFFARVPAWTLLVLALLGLVFTIWACSRLRQPQQHRRGVAVAQALAEVPHTLKHMLHNTPAPLALFRPMYGGTAERLPNGLWRNPDASFVDPGYVLLTAFDDAHNRAELHLVRLGDGKVVHRYVPDNDAMIARSHFTSALIDLKRDKGKARNLMMHPLLMDDGGVIIHDTTPLTRIDACGKVQWIVDGIFHHSVQRGADGQIWAAYRFPRSAMPEVTDHFHDEAVAEVSPQGKLLRLIRIADILDDNGLGALWRNRPYTDDPFHLNDVQPVLGDSRYWQRGDLLLSLRNMSMLLLYRPSTGKVLWWKVGPWSAQHDVSVVNDHQISVFDNHWMFAAPEGKVDGSNRVLVYDFATDTVSAPYAQAMAPYHIHTRAQGRATPLANGDWMIEETEPGRLMRIAADGTLRWRYISADADQNRFQLRWSRYLDPDKNQRGITAAEEAQCK